MAFKLELPAHSSVRSGDGRGNDGLTDAQRDLLAAEHRAYAGNFDLHADDVAAVKNWLKTHVG